MAIHIQPETEARLIAKAKAEGVSIDALLNKLMIENDATPVAKNGHTPELPAWPLGAKGTFHRRDIYDDVL